MNKVRSLLFGVLIFGALGVGYLTLRAGLSSSQDSFQPGKQVVIGEGVKLAVNFGNEEKIEVEQDFEEGETAFSLLQKVIEEKEIEMEIKQYDFGVFVQSIGGYESGTDLAWIYFINGESGSVAADQYELEAGDTVEWKYIKPEF